MITWIKVRITDPAGDLVDRFETNDEQVAQERIAKVVPYVPGADVQITRSGGTR